MASHVKTLKSALLAGAIALGGLGPLTLAAPAAEAAVHVGVVIPVAPPAPRREHRPPPPHRHHMSYTWQEGHWRWNGHRYVWASGHYVKTPRHHAAWADGRWQHRPGGWVWIDGHWR